MSEQRLSADSVGRKLVALQLSSSNPNIRPTATALHMSVMGPTEKDGQRQMKE
jgi:hypothetical protein